MPDYTLTNAEVDALSGALASLGARDYTDPKTRYALNKLKRQVKPSLEALQESLQDLVNRFGEKDAEGKLIPQGAGVKLADGVGFQAARKVLMAETTVIPGVRQLTVKELCAVPGTANELEGLGPLLEDKEPE